MVSCPSVGRRRQKPKPTQNAMVIARPVVLAVSAFRVIGGLYRTHPPSARTCARWARIRAEATHGSGCGILGCRNLVALFLSPPRVSVHMRYPKIRNQKSRPGDISDLSADFNFLFPAQFSLFAFCWFFGSPGFPRSPAGGPRFSGKPVLLRKATRKRPTHGVRAAYPRNSHFACNLGDPRPRTDFPLDLASGAHFFRAFSPRVGCVRNLGGALRRARL